MTPAFIILLSLVLMVDLQPAQASSVMFNCGGTQCPSGQDCLQVEGTSRCMDPCDHYTPLDDAWRATDVGGNSPYHCDNNNNNGRPAWQGWYRLFLGNSSIQMPERCIGKFMCGTEAPLWLQTPHPQLSAGIIQAQVCGHWSSDCCRFKEKPIHVKACPRNYYVYKFLQPSQCNLVYCADVNTKLPVCETCSAAETCVIDDKSNDTIVWRCEETPTRDLTTPPTASSVRFSCGGRQCPSGQDCLQVEGTSRCMDPCDHYTPLDDAWRATDRGRGAHCDRRSAWQGWYRLFLGNSSVQMPERCLDWRVCETQAPLWLQTPHPRLSAGIIEAQVCGSSWRGRLGGCCDYKSHPIHVKACPRNYYVYKFIKPRGCDFAYCADVNTLVCNNCTAAETCVSNDKINWRCERQDTSTRHPTTSPTETTTRHPTTSTTETSTRDLTTSPTGEPSFSESELVCGQEQMRLKVPKRILEEQGLNGSSAHLIDPRCHQQVDDQETISYLVQRREVCGSVVKNNGTHVTYSNILFVYPSDRSESSLSVPRSFTFSCDFPLDDITSLDAAIRYQPPASRRDGGEGVVSSGDPTKVSMTLFKSPDFSEAFPSGPVRLPLGSALHVAVSVNNTEYDGFGLLLETCYVTHSLNASDPRKHFLIENRCAVDRRHVQVIESGASLRACFSALLFLYHGTYEDVYLHCRISMCDRSSAPCSPNCSRRQARSAASSSNQLIVAVGPISWF